MVNDIVLTYKFHCRMARERVTARKSTRPRYRPIVITICDTPPTTDSELDTTPRFGDSENDPFTESKTETPLTDSRDDDIHIIEPPPIPMIDLLTESEEEELDPSLNETNADNKGELVALADLEDLPLSCEELRLRAIERGQKIYYFGKWRTPAKRTRFACSPSLPSPDRSNVNESGYEGDWEWESTKRVRGI
jgi:hypothetical protein